MKKKVIHAEYRKDSNTFPEWLKYEMTILNEDGTTNKVPAYGKDLQDALSRVVHDEKVENVVKRTKRIPDVVWVMLWFGYVLGWTMLTYELSPYNKFNGLFFLGGMGLITGLTFWLKTWFRQRNIDKN